ncbi:MerR family transcriptional regulator [Intrasporangium sp.]|uniref:DNA polymerase III subunit beta family protein n=1 Tax=Intrasporangium sp. TaxID=1925024 RepID=UPI00293B3A87|nr:MerR family transcriptional regulator [Intrasporangium sp.]MDV3220078.1 MerR family transcriptional regulator [Intrasporangium sp.]
MTELLTIGELARLSGLSASSLRFYDREGLLVPARVDPSSGYRRYSEAQVPVARLVAGLRRVGMPLSEVAVVLDLRARGSVGDARDVVVAHETRLEQGLQDARREIARTLDLLGDGEPTRHVTVSGHDLSRALRTVRFAVAQEPAEDLAVLAGVLVEAGPEGLRLVATDRYRLAVGVVEGARTIGPPLVPHPATASVVVPPDWLEQVGVTAGRQPVHLAIGEAVCIARVGASELRAPSVPGAFPDYRRILDWDRARLAQGIDALPLLDSMGRRSGDGPPGAVGLADVDGVAHVVGRRSEAEVHVNGEFLLEALAAVDGDPSLVLDGPIAPLAVRGSDGGLSVLMPVRADRTG